MSDKKYTLPSIKFGSPVIFFRYNILYELIALKKCCCFDKRLTKKESSSQILKNHYQHCFFWCYLSIANSSAKSEKCKHKRVDSSDLNPIQHVCDEIGKRLRRHVPAPRNSRELRNIVVQKWNNLPLNIIQNLIQSMPRRLQFLLFHRKAYQRKIVHFHYFAYQSKFVHSHYFQ